MKTDAENKKINRNYLLMYGVIALGTLVTLMRVYDCGRVVGYTNGILTYDRAIKKYLPDVYKLLDDTSLSQKILNDKDLIKIARSWVVAKPNF